MTQDGIHWKGRQAKRVGLPSMSRVQMQILRFLRDSEDAGFPFADLPGIHGRTINTLVRHDWIFPSKGIDGSVCYKITGRGRKAMEAYETKPYRLDGICRRCNKRPRKVSANGNLQGYCAECKREMERSRYRREGYGLRSDVPCSRCKTRPRHRRASGAVITYCIECSREVRKEGKQRAKVRLLEKLRAGEFVPCIRCGEAPRYHTPNSVYDYCHKCYREMQNSYLRRKAKEVKHGA